MVLFSIKIYIKSAGKEKGIELRVYSLVDMQHTWRYEIVGYFDTSV